MTATPGIPGYTISGIIGEGGYATVYRGWQVAVGREVAVKVDNRVLVSERDRRRFVREVTAAGRLSGHPHVVDIYDAGTLSDGRPYMVMEFCPGGSLADAVRRNGVMSPAQVRDIGIKIADALAAAHASGVLHRDIKPANILLNQYGMVGLSDFGLASILAPGGDHTVTRESLTPAYASPERFRGLAPTVACDLYSLAATLYDLLAGRPPGFPADGSPPSLAALVALDGKPVDDIPGVPSAMMAVLRRSLAADPAARPPSAAQLRDELSAAPASQALSGWETLTVTNPWAGHTAAEPAAGSTAPPAVPARHARKRLPADSTGAGAAAGHWWTKPRLAALATTCIVVAAAAALLSARALPSGHSPQPLPSGHSPQPTASISPQLTQQVKDLMGRVDNSKNFTRCTALARPVAGAEATLDCQARQPGITASVSSFKTTGEAIPFVPTETIPAESDGLNTFLTSLGRVIVPSFSSPVCVPSGTETCPEVGSSEYWGDPDGVVRGRLYCYKQASLYYIAWTFDNDSYEASFLEDFVVVASGRNLASLIKWWYQTPV